MGSVVSTAPALVFSAQQQKIFEWFEQRSDGHLVVRARAGCLAADTMISINRAGKGWSLPLIELVAKFHGAPFMAASRSDGSPTRPARGWDRDIPTFIQQERHGVIRLARLKDAWWSGEKPTYAVTLQDGKMLRATDEHPFCTADGWKRLDQLTVDMPVCVRSSQRLNGPAPKKTYPTLSGLWQHPFATRSEPDETHRYGSARVPLHRLVVEAAKNALSLEEFLNRVFTGDIKQLWFLNPETHVAHHRDRNPQNNALVNIELLTVVEHKHLHATEGTDENVAFKVDYVPVKAIAPSTKEPTFDLSIADDYPHNFVANGLVVHNSGKTSTILEGITGAPESRILLAAFNKRIQEELQSRLQNPHAEAKTLHGVGYHCVRRYWENVPMASGNKRALALADEVCGGQAPDPIKRLVATLTTKAREIAPHATEPGQLTDLALEFECEPDEEWSDAGWDLAYVEKRALDAMALAASKKPADGIDFADMLYLPVRNRWLVKKYDLVVVDEAQDMTVTQLEIAQGVCAGRIAVVGDDRQAIYSFRGADSRSLDRLKAELSARELGLTVTYRCGRVIAAAAKVLVPDLEPSPYAPEGEIRQVPTIDAVVAMAEPHDFILSRTNAPLAKVAMALLRAQKRVRIQGKDIGAGLLSLVRKLMTGKAAQSIPMFLERLEHWEDREIARAYKMDREERAEVIRDKAETLRVLTDGVSGPRELEARLGMLFSDEGNGGRVVCSSVHKAKGLEAPRVFVLRPTLYPRPRKGQVFSPARLLEEANIEYVAVTRAINTLVWVEAK